MFKKPIKFPPDFPGLKPKQKKHYKHTVTVLSSTVAEYAYDLSFTSEKKAKAFKRLAEEATNKPIVEYERTEVPVLESEGFINGV